MGAALVAGRAAGLAALLVVVVAGLAGTTDAPANLAPVAVYTVLWLGVALLSALAGEVWAWINPLASLARLAGGRREPTGADGLDRWGRWPAALGLLGFTWLWLVYPSRAEPRVIGAALVAHVAAVLAMATRWGRKRLDRYEPFTAWFGMLALLGPLHRTAGGRVALRPPVSGLRTLRPVPGTEAVPLVVVGAVAFDALTTTGLWFDLAAGAGPVGRTLLGTLGLGWCVLAAGVVYQAVVQVIGHQTGLDPARARRGFAGVLVPIAFGLIAAQYLPFVLHEGQAAIALASDPLGRGWDLFGTAGRAIGGPPLSPRAMAWVQLGALVAGHLAAVVAAHHRAQLLLPPPAASRAAATLFALIVASATAALTLLLGA